MHVLTKLFIVLVSLLAVLLVPLVVVYAHNENAYEAKFQSAESRLAALSSAFEAAKASQTAVVLRKDNQIQELESLNIDLQKEGDRQETELRGLQARLAEAEDMDAEIRTHISQLDASFKASQELTQSLIDELRGLRREALAAERQKVELDDALRDREAQLDAAVEARKAVQEELQRLKDEHANSLNIIQRYVAQYGKMEDELLINTGLLPDKALDCTILSVRRNTDQTLAEVDAGARDGVQVGWMLSIGRGGNFLARLRIISVDINRSTGVIELESESSRGRVEPGDHVYARPGP